MHADCSDQYQSTVCMHRRDDNTVPNPLVFWCQISRDKGYRPVCVSSCFRQENILAKACIVGVGKMHKQGCSCHFIEKENKVYYIQNVLCQGYCCYCFIVVMTEVGGRGGSTISSV